jgi:hypothetical protein
MDIAATILTIVFGSVGMIVGIVGIYQAFKNSSHEISREISSDAQQDGAMRSDVVYIKRRIDDVLLEQKDTNKILSEHGERLTRVEESAKQAHKRIDGIENRLTNE